VRGRMRLVLFSHRKVKWKIFVVSYTRVFLSAMTSACTMMLTSGCGRFSVGIKGSPDAFSSKARYFSSGAVKTTYEERDKIDPIKEKDKL